MKWIHTPIGLLNLDNVFSIDVESFKGKYCIIAYSCDNQSRLLDTLDTEEEANAHIKIYKKIIEERR